MSTNVQIFSNCNKGIFLDYQDYNNPKILNPDTFNDSWFDKSTKGIENIVFNEQRYSSSEAINLEIYDENQDEILICGVPLWYQYPDIPICPKTKEVMKFVCTINSDRSIGLKDRRSIENLPFGDYLIFGDHGNLFVFYQPNSKVLYLNIQF